LSKDIILYFLNNLTIRLATYQPLFDAIYSKFNEFSFYFSFPTFIIIVCSFSINFFSFLLCLNRLTSVYKYSSHENLWKKYYKYSIIISLVSSFLLGFYPLLSRYKYISYNDGNANLVAIVPDPIFPTISVSFKWFAKYIKF
jgi:hypothetical protein